MSARFLITGLPRSRTAWMAVAATGANSICYHEPMSWLPKWRDAFDLWNDPTYDFVGVSDSGFGFRLREILDQFKPQVLIIDRDIQAVEASFMRLEGRLTNYARLLNVALAPFGDGGSVKRVKFDDLSKDEVVMECLEHLMPGRPVDLAKIRELQRLDIQADMSIVRDSVKERLGEIADLLGPEIMAAHVAIEAEAA